ncbi:acyltransferase family protein [Mucilaginibacter psychrotolerans]|uniref:Acyltransferase n=1 Tax=Mucilaginibacter psychrotolerans TaxID=1524096 RepID=A0A4Y8SH16_9SPHI|nr:acyltransferase [Mucilaginibacter psychrotolerans]TFF38319.1 acyltransferase [Mucilaginibacter psychrotolerans]
MERDTNTLYIIRFFAALVVVLFHYTPAGLQQHITFLIKNGGEAVNLFFFISGFVLTVSNARFFSNKQSQFNKKDFYIKRVARIYPLYILALLLLAAFHYGIKAIDTPSVKYRLPFEVVGIQRWLYAGSFNYPGWSVSCEFFFYLFFPFIAQYLRASRQAFPRLVWLYYFAAVFATYMLSVSVKADLPSVEKKLVVALYLNPLFLISTFLFGVLAGKCFLENSIAFFTRGRNNFIAGIASLAIIVLAKYYAPNGSALLKGGILAPVYFVFILAITSFTKKQARFVTGGACVFLGEISYCMYIVQYPVYVFYTRYIQQVTSFASLFNYTIALICFSSLVHLAVEKPLRKLITAYYLGSRKAEEIAAAHPL